MRLSGLHFLLTYRCILECDHCFVWGSPRSAGTFTLRHLEVVLRQAKEAGLEWIYFEGGEPFLFYALLVEGVKIAAGMGFHVGCVTNAYWATSPPDAIEWLKPLAALEDLGISSDLHHSEVRLSDQPQNAAAAARWLHIPTSLITIAEPASPAGDAGDLMYRGRAATKLASQAKQRPWTRFTECPHEDLRDPGRVHVDPSGNVHVCQGVVIGNLFKTSLVELCQTYTPETHPVCGPLFRGGPTELVRAFDLQHRDKYADACHLCYEAREALRPRFPASLGPDQMYGVES